MSSEVEIRIMIRDGTAVVGGFAAEAGLPAPEAGMGAGESAAVTGVAPSPVEGVGGAEGAAEAFAGEAPSPTSVGAFEGVAATGELPSPLPLEEVERLVQAGPSAGISDLPEPDEDAG